MQADNFCSTEIEKAYRWLVTAALLLPQFDAKARAFLDQQLANITEAAILKVTSALWADNGSVELVANQLRNQRAVIWPPYEPLSDNALSKAFDSWFYENATFTQHWIRSVTRWRQLRMSPIYRRSDDSPRSYAFPYFEYDPFSNVVRVSAAALFIPWYQAAGSKAALYGGIGFTFAREVVKSFDGATPAFDRRGEFLDTWPTKLWKETSVNKASCLRPEFRYGVSRDSRSGDCVRGIPGVVRQRRGSLAADCQGMEPRTGVLRHRLLHDVQPAEHAETLSRGLQQGGKELRSFRIGLQVPGAFENESSRKVLLL
ncbi:hypothetical protein HPB49_001657 [Dermacentor silvarum]|uniref:Uncharacterized protein n=1 Tax=Dermacentor silvarum TaxID=543639 RepID=A0ACB8D9W3_DERSI|nr:hypothetical protein HPB49_001657 [Dermacentor silvarum]